MIPFFRKIRKQLADDNKALKYFRYAVGEIVLVVVGILIALQINNWNQARTDRQKEQLYIALLTEEVKGEIDYLKRLRSNFEKMSKGIERITQQWQSGSEVINDTLEYLRDYTYGSGMDPWYREPITWTQLQQTGDLNLLRDNRLTDSLFVFYGKLRNLGDNFLLNPMQEYMATRHIMNGPLLDYGGTIYIFKYIGTYGIEKDTFQLNNEIFARIWEYRKQLFPNYVRVSTICHFQVSKLNAIIDSGEALLLKLKLSQTASL